MILIFSILFILLRAVSQHLFCFIICLQYLQVATMPSLKLILSYLYKKFSSFISPYPDLVQRPALQLYKTISSITRYSSHLKFLRFCLKHKLVPKGSFTLSILLFQFLTMGFLGPNLVECPRSTLFL